MGGLLGSGSHYLVTLIARRASSFFRAVSFSWFCCPLFLTTDESFIFASFLSTPLDGDQRVACCWLSSINNCLCNTIIFLLHFHSMHIFRLLLPLLPFFPNVSLVITFLITHISHVSGISRMNIRTGNRNKIWLHHYVLKSVDLAVPNHS